MVQMRRTGRGPELEEVQPATCPKGHRLAPPNVQVCYEITPDGRRCRAWRCWTCGALTYDTLVR